MEPISTLATLPTKLSGPYWERICWKATRAPLPDRGRSKASGKTSLGMPNTLAGACRARQSSWTAPEEESAPTVRVSSNSEGNISHTTRRPSSTPLAKADSRSTRRSTATKNTRQSRAGTTRLEKKLMPFSSFFASAARHREMPFLWQQQCRSKPIEPRRARQRAESPSGRQNRLAAAAWQRWWESAEERRY